MSTESRKSTAPLVAAVAATTVAVGVTVATLVGWLRPPAAPVAPVAAAEPVATSAPAIEPDPAPPPEPQVARHHHHEEEHEDDDD